ncbi:DMT family transporter [Sedimentitalea nanhaiensis]|uniref:EamA-like transporter family protein n=1 Tax=Sedimentitalea nanhaiensis TaxID=999627 RepID=A0A1I7AMX3_9RHOB|nr:DMT family transporter [Sedimentitalea nanhaiensis]SFT76299.1 EamA-like transporter family protein [Sedimentitalea nanhaiensis]
MDERRAIDGFGATALIGLAAILAFNQVVVKLTGGGFGPVFQAALRSAVATVFLLIWMRARAIPLASPVGTAWWGIASGFVFSFEFICLYSALDLTSVSRASIIFYSMPVWVALAAHVLLPGERLSTGRGLGLALALAGVALAFSDRSSGQASLAGDLLALGAALGWAAIAIMVRVTPMSRMRHELQLLYQVTVSAVVLLALAPLFGDLVRDLQWIHIAGLGFQAIIVVGLGYLMWFWLLTIYPANSVASFSFLSPVLAVLFGWALLGETIGPKIWVALLLVTAGIFLINRR